MLIVPLAGAVLLGVFGARRWAAEANVCFSGATFIAACVLTVRVLRDGSLVAAREQFFIDPFNVFLVVLTAFVGFTTALFSRPYMRIEAEHGRIGRGRLRLYHSMYQLFMATMLVALTTNNLGLLWVAMEAAMTRIPVLEGARMGVYGGAATLFLCYAANAWIRRRTSHWTS